MTREQLRQSDPLFAAGEATGVFLAFEGWSRIRRPGLRNWSLGQDSWQGIVMLAVGVAIAVDAFFVVMYGGRPKMPPALICIVPFLWAVGRKRTRTVDRVTPTATQLFSGAGLAGNILFDLWMTGARGRDVVLAVYAECRLGIVGQARGAIVLTVLVGLIPIPLHMALASVGPVLVLAVGAGTFMLARAVARSSSAHAQLAAATSASRLVIEPLMLQAGPKRVIGFTPSSRINSFGQMVLVFFEAGLAVVILCIALLLTLDYQSVAGEALIYIPYALAAHLVHWLYTGRTWQIEEVMEPFLAEADRAFDRYIREVVLQDPDA